MREERIVSRVSKIFTGDEGGVELDATIPGPTKRRP